MLYESFEFVSTSKCGYHYFNYYLHCIISYNEFGKVFVAFHKPFFLLFFTFTILIFLSVQFNCVKYTDGPQLIMV